MLIIAAVVAKGLMRVAAAYGRRRIAHAATTRTGTLVIGVLCMAALGVTGLGALWGCVHVTQRIRDRAVYGGLIAGGHFESRTIHDKDSFAGKNGPAYVIHLTPTSERESWKPTALERFHSWFRDQDPVDENEEAFVSKATWNRVTVGDTVTVLRLSDGHVEYVPSRSGDLPGSFGDRSAILIDVWIALLFLGFGVWSLGIFVMPLARWFSSLPWYPGAPQDADGRVRR